MKCMCCGKEMRNTIGGCYTCDECGFTINDLVYRGGKGWETTLEENINAEWTDKDSINLPLNTTPTTTEGLATSSIQGDYIGFGRQGWICPKCGATLSPYTSFCPFCAPKQTTTTTCTPSTDVECMKYQTITLSSGKGDK